MSGRDGRYDGGTSESTQTPHAPEGLEDAVEQLLDEVATEPLVEPTLSLRSLRGRIAIVTGGSTGIGRATAIALAQNGVHVAFNYLEKDAASQDEAEEVARILREMEVRVFYQSCDVRDPAAVNSFVEAAEREMSGVHILINNAGVGRDRALWRMSDDEWNTVVETNLSGAFYCLRAVAPIFRAQEFGKIVNVSSVHAYRTEFGLANYCSSKAGIIGLTRSAAMELGSSNINVNAVAPGYIRTTQLTEKVPAEIMDQARERSALGRLGDPQDVASVILFLCSEVARHITGAVIPVDGGYVL